MVKHHPRDVEITMKSSYFFRFSVVMDSKKERKTHTSHCSVIEEQHLYKPNPGFAIITWNNQKKMGETRDITKGLATCQSLGWIFPCNKVLLVDPEISTTLPPKSSSLHLLSSSLHAQSLQKNISATFTKEKLEFCGIGKAYPNQYTWERKRD